MRKQPLLLLIAALLSLPGCSEMPTQATPQETQEETADSRQVTPSGPELPEVELTQDLLYKILVAEFASMEGALPLSAKLYLNTATETRDPRLAEQATRIAIYARDGETALEAARLWVELDPNNPDARQSLAALLIRSDKVDEAAVHLEKVINLSPEDTSHNYQLVANLLSRDKDKERALGVMQQVIKPHMDDPNALFAYAHLAYQLGANDEAESATNKVLELDPENQEAMLLQARLFHALGKEEEAIASLKQALKQSPDNDQLRLTYARMLVDAHHLPEARKQFKILHRHLPDNADVTYALGLLAMEAGDLDDADLHFTKLVAQREHEEEARYNLGQIAELRKQPQDAIEWYQSVPQGENYMAAQLQAARIISEEKGIDAARDHLSQLPLQDPDDQVKRYMAEAELLSGADRLDEAMAVYDDGLIKFKDNPDLLYGRALTAEKLDRLDLLERDLRKILENDPENSQALNALGYTLTDRTGRHEEALTYIQRAYKQKPEDPGILDSMGWVLYHLGRKDEALEYLQRAANLLDDAEISAHLGEVLWSLGRKDEARKVWDKALKLEPDQKTLQQTIERFTQ